MKKIIFILCIITSFSCLNKKNFQEQLSILTNQENQDLGIGKWYVLNLTEEGDTILNTITRVIKITRDSLIDDDVMERTSYRILNKKEENNSLYLSLDTILNIKNSNGFFKLSLTTQDLGILYFPDPYSLPYDQSFLVTSNPNKYKLIDNSSSFESDQNSSIIDKIQMKTWSADCSSNLYIYITLSRVQLTFNSVAINTIIKEENDSINLFFHYPIIRPIPEDLMDCKDYSQEKPIGKIELLDDNTIKFSWYGFYNTKIKERVHTENPFGVKESYTILKQCIDN